MNPGSRITGPKGSRFLKISERWYPFIFPSATFSHSSSTRYQYCIRYLFCILSDLLGFIGPLTVCSSPATVTATNSSFVGAQPGSTCSHFLPQAPWMPLGCEILGTHSAPTHLPTGWTFDGGIWELQDKFFFCPPPRWTPQRSSSS